MYSSYQKHIFHVLNFLRASRISSQNILITEQFSNLLFLNKQLNCALLYIKGTKQFSKMTNEKPGLDLSEVVRRLDHYAPKHLAESWDNVGLLLEPSMKKIIKKIILTNDLTEEVMDEALEAKTDLIITYHPLIFRPLKSILEKSWKERIIAQCFENRIAVYSPHTSFDVINGGVNDWLASAFETCSVKPLIQKYAPDFSLITHLVEIKIPIICVKETFKAALKEMDKNIELNVEMCSADDQTKLTIPCSEASLPKLMTVYQDHVLQKCEGSSFRILKYQDVPIPNVGVGRLCLLKTPLKVKEVVEMVKQHIDIPHLRLALAVKKTQESTVSSIALCAGSGADVLRGVSADLLLTGEMLHHDILDATHRGSHVILCNHSDSERGFLKGFCEILSTKLLENNVEVMVSKTDKDPTVVV